jgi:hypothetical protein
MKRKNFLLVTALFVLALLLTTPVLAREHHPIGDRINLFDGDQAYPANTPFYVMHGMGWHDVIPGHWSFELEVDGVPVKPTYKELTTDVFEGYGQYHRSIYTFNFPEGMTGTHVFEGHWILPCQEYLNYGWVEDCARPPEEIEDWYAIVTVEFTP